MSKKDKNELRPDGLMGEWRIRGKSGAGYVGRVTSFFDNALVMEQVDKETVIIMLDSIESMYEGIISPKASEELEKPAETQE